MVTVAEQIAAIEELIRAIRAVIAENEADIVKIGRPCCSAWTRRVENERPSRVRSTSYTMDLEGSPGCRK